MNGIRRHGSGWQAEVRVVGHPRWIKQYPPDADLALIRRERDQANKDLQKQTRRATVGTFAADAKKYLVLVRTMPSFTDRERDIRLWVEVFGTRHRASITKIDIQLQRDEWFLHGPRRVFKPHTDRHGGQWIDLSGPLAASTVNHRLRALANLYTVLDGRHAPNPARDVPELDEPDGVARALPYSVIEAILAAMPDRGQGKKGESRADISKTKARLRMIAYAGVPHASLARLTPDRVSLEGAWIDTGRRKKGKGARTGRRPLTPQGLEALQAFIAADAWGTFSRSAMRKSFSRAVETVIAALEQTPDGQELAAQLRRLRARPYDLRHSYVSEVLEKSADFHATQLLADHAALNTTLEYGKHAVNPALRSALAKVSGAGGFAASGNRATDATD
jgi:integrase